MQVVLAVGVELHAVDVGAVCGLRRRPQRRHVLGRSNFGEPDEFYLPALGLDLAVYREDIDVDEQGVKGQVAEDRRPEYLVKAAVAAEARSRKRRPFLRPVLDIPV